MLDFRSALKETTLGRDLKRNICGKLGADPFSRSYEKLTDAGRRTLRHGISSLELCSGELKINIKKNSIFQILCKKLFLKSNSCVALYLTDKFPYFTAKNVIKWDI